MHSVTGDTTSLVPGFPIRTSSDQRSVDSSPRHFAASHVLHRLPVPRHPPCALKHLQKPLNMSKNCTSNNTQQTHPQDKPGGRLLACKMLATTIHKSNTTPHHQDGATTTPTTNTGNPASIRAGPPPTTVKGDRKAAASKPNSVSDDPPHPQPASKDQP